MGNRQYAQGDVFLVECDLKLLKGAEEVNRDPDGACVLARGEVTGHRHAFYGPQVTLFRDTAGGYLLKVEAPSAPLKHEEHSTVEVPQGVYRLIDALEYSPQEIKRVVD